VKGTGVFRYYYRSQQPPNEPPGHQWLSEKDLFAAESRIERVVSSVGGQVPVWAQDLLRVARAVYLADKRSLREWTPDRWTRRITLDVQLVEPERWDESALDVLTKLLTALTSDMWDISVSRGAIPDIFTPPLVGGWSADEIMLFSGGIDSTAYLAEAVTRDDGPLLLISYYEQKIKSCIDDIYEATRRNGARRTEYHPISARVRDWQKTRLEPSSRSRGLLFMATAVYAAAAHRAVTVTAPENGQLAINPAITESRLGACSSRSVHPYVLDLLNTLIRRLGGEVRVSNPYTDLTKGEVCERARDAGLDREVIWRTVSCSSPPIMRRNGGYHCGYCFPCLVRRSGLLAAFGEDRTGYDVEFWNTTRSAKKDAHALRRWLARPFRTTDLIADMPLPAGLTASSLMPVLRRGRRELIDMFQRLVPADSDFLQNWRPADAHRRDAHGPVTTRSAQPVPKPRQPLRDEYRPAVPRPRQAWSGESTQPRTL